MRYFRVIEMSKETDEEQFLTIRLKEVSGDGIDHKNYLWGANMFIYVPEDLKGTFEVMISAIFSHLFIVDSVISVDGQNWTAVPFANMPCQYLYPENDDYTPTEMWRIH